MSKSEATAPGRMGYNKARLLLLAAGLGVLILVAVFQFIRGKEVDPTETAGTLLFIPVFIAFVFGNVVGGVVAGILASVGYLALRYPAIRAIGAENFIELVLARALFYVGFGAIGGWANKQLETSLNKLELYDQIDDYTGLFNARFFVQDTDLEMSRAKRYQTLFSVAVVDLPVGPLEGLPRRQRKATRREMGRLLKEAVRIVDRPVHGFDGSRHRFAIVLPETSQEGAQIFRDRLAERLSGFLSERRFHLDPGDIEKRSVTFPEDGEEAIEAIRTEYRMIDRVEHPEAESSSSS